MNLALTALVAGVVAGAIYSLVAVGMVVAYTATRAVNFAQGDLLTLGMYTVVVGVSHWHLSYWAVLPLAAVFGGGVGLLMERIGYRPFASQLSQGDGALLTIFVATLAMSFALSGILSVTTTTQGTGLPNVLPNRVYEIGALQITPTQILIVGASSFCLAAMFSLLKFTQLGRAMRAVAQHRNASQLVGANPARLGAFAWALSGVLAVVAGALLAPGSIVTPYVGEPYLFIAFAAAVVGGFGSIPGAALGAFVLSIGQAFFGAYISLAWTEIVPFALMIAVLLIRPSGLLGTSSARV